ncbi:MAG TPA: hypothetical protein PKW55_06855 [Spirochaetota bacterium]|nr:hypothetical protein [Spirochaetota bacterium]HOM38766.1 hypothetical protein [Spirochaetota bacterium]HPQ49564.1 hypothetical protein [Spirochaetota bacterium]
MKKLVIFLLFIYNVSFSEQSFKNVEELILKNDLDIAYSYLKEYENQKVDESKKRELFYLYCWIYFLKKDYDNFIDYAKKIGSKVKDDIFYNTALLSSLMYYKTKRNSNGKKIIDYILKSESPIDYKIAAVLIDKIYNKSLKSVNIDFLIDYIIKDYTGTFETQKVICKPLEEIEIEKKGIEKQKKELGVLRLLLDEKKRLLELKESYIKEKESLIEEKGKRETKEESEKDKSPEKNDNLDKKDLEKNKEGKNE